VATIKVFFIPGEGWADLFHQNNESGEDIDEFIYKAMNLRASINYYGLKGSYLTPGYVSPIDESVRFKTFLEGTLSQEKLDSIGLGLNQTSEVRDLSSIQNSEWEERAQIDVELNLVSEFQSLIMEIKSILIEGSFQGEDEMQVEIDIQEP
jgi:hypothetical protein